MTREEFVKEIRKLCDLIDDDEAVASQFEVAKSTVRRWRSGAAVPHPRSRELIINELNVMLDDRIRIMEEVNEE